MPRKIVFALVSALTLLTATVAHAEEQLDCFVKITRNGRDVVLRPTLIHTDDEFKTTGWRFVKMGELGVFPRYVDMGNMESVQRFQRRPWIAAAHFMVSCPPPTEASIVVFVVPLGVPFNKDAPAFTFSSCSPDHSQINPCSVAEIYCQEKPW